MPPKPRPRFNVPMLIVVVAAVILPLYGLYAFLRYASERGAISKDFPRCRRLVTALHVYAMDHDGKYPDAFLTNPRSSNEVFRLLLKEGIVENELDFGALASPYVPDGNIGTAPEFAQALEAGENHWAMTAGLGASASGEIPAIYENPAVAAWPPKWNARAVGKSVPGRTWSHGVIVGFNDTSVDVRELESSEGTTAGLAKKWGTEDLFERAIDPVKFPKGVVLDVLKKAE
jgi:hypothetical protein